MNKGDIEVELERLRANSTLISPFYSLLVPP